MPINEKESHPYLRQQVNIFTEKSQLSKYTKLIVGTFPVYAITESVPIEQTGVEKRRNWQSEAFIQYFYGSEGSHFWNLLASSFNEQKPNTKDEAIALLNKYGFLISDVFNSVSRNNYSPLDSDLRNSSNNESLKEIVRNSESLKVIYFTSKAAKVAFCKILDITYINSVDSIEPILGREYRLIILISPAGNGRTVRHFFNIFPLSGEEVALRKIKSSYALLYRKRYYMHYLTAPITY